MEMMYATCEQVARSLEILHTAYANDKIIAAIKAASRNAEEFLHRVFYPELRTIRLDWPNASGLPTWQVDLWDQEMISLTTVVSGGTTITNSCILRRADDLAKPPYGILEIDRTTDAAFSGGTSPQRSLVITGTFGYADTETSLAGGALSGGINSSVATITINPSSGTFTPGIGSLLLIDTERLVVVNRLMASTAITTSSALLDIKNSVSFTTASSSSFSIGETILIDSERMRINDIAGTSIIVERATDGTVLAAHSSGATIYALRSFIVRRGVLGSTAASHSDAASVYVHEWHPSLNALVRGEAIVMLAQESAAFARTIGSGAGTREAAGLGLDDLRERAWRTLGRKNRSAAI